ncbi:hypothetical protein DNTS_006525 [Danionella cerebrum]|uniref:Ig-like domain-containing protein n=1 Tax=Danionella cerebrum TaxID=2873325 RepID=A0A553RHM5_9TELE|nr:hypothetical protein DNTS_006525 [Danionella translucida]
MKVYLFHFIFMLNFSKGCVVSKVDLMTKITGYTGGSALLPCSCTQAPSKVNTFTWSYHSHQWFHMLEDEKYRGRLVLFNQSSSANLSLLISGLRTEDAGVYKCMSESTTTFIELTVQSCNLVRTEGTIDVSGQAGESVLLPCFCSELQATPEHTHWMYLLENVYKEIYPKEQIGRYKNRVELMNGFSPGNVSLLITDLTMDDQGIYYCAVSSQIVSFDLLVHEKPHVHTTKSPSLPPSPTLDPKSPPKTQNTPPYIIILLGVFLCGFLLVLQVFIVWRCKACRKWQKTSSVCEGPKIEAEDQDGVMYSAVVHGKSISAAAQTHPVELTEYASIRVK